MKVNFEDRINGTTNTGELQQWVYHPDVGVEAVILTPDGRFVVARIFDVSRSDDQ